MSGSLTITDSRIIDNHIDGLNPPTPPTTSPRLRGSGIYAQVKTLTIVRSEIADNSATGVANPGGAVGGGLNVENNASTLLPAGESMVVTIINSTISGNAVSGSGGAMGVSGNVTVELDNSTFSDNSAPSTGTGGILIETASATAPTLAVVSSILAKNTGNGLDVVTGSGIDTFTINATSSLIGAICSTCNVSPPSGSGNLLGYDPLLGPLAFNGGPTRTQALLAGSPAIDTGSNPPPPDPLTDQRGVVRAQGLAPDMGAFELQDATPPVVLCDVPDDAWHSSDVTIGCTASDPESGLDIPADATFNLTTNTAPGTETAIAATGSYSVRNNLGAFTQAGPITPNKVDKKPPTITITSPTANATYQVSANVGASYACADGGSGVASCAGTVANGGLIDTSTTGSKTFTVNATDNVSNGASPFNVTYSVVSGGGGGTSYADVGITLSAANSVPSGGTLTYSMTVTNSGPATATGVVASVAIPAGAVFASASAPQGVTVAAPPVGSGGTVTANLGTLAKGATATINVAVTVTAPYTSKATLTSTASVTATTPDKISTNNSATKVTSMTKK